jgi:hypothetical protein
MRNESFAYTIPLSLSINSPKKDIEVDFQKNSADILDAVKAFNEKYANVKEIEIMEIGKTVLNLILWMDGVKDITGRQIAYFSKILRKDFGWDKFSKYSDRLFKRNKKEELLMLNR